MNVSQCSVHPVEAPPFDNGDNNAPILRMKDIHGMPGTAGGLALRLCQFFFAVAALWIMVSTTDFISVTAFCYLVAAVGLQSLWSLSLAIVDIYALLVRRCLRNHQVVSLFTIGDGLFKKGVRLQITSTLTFAAASASAGITALISKDLGYCSQNPCTRFKTATTMAFLCWFTISPSFLLNFWSLTSH